MTSSVNVSFLVRTLLHIVSEQFSFSHELQNYPVEILL